MISDIDKTNVLHQILLKLDQEERDMNYENYLQPQENKGDDSCQS